MAVDVSEGVVDPTLPPGLDAVERLFEGDSQLRIGSAEGGNRLRGQATIPQQQPKGIWVDRHAARFKLDRLSHKRQLEPPLMRCAQPSDHLSRLDDATRLIAPAVPGGPELPEML